MHEFHKSNIFMADKIWWICVHCGKREEKRKQIQKISTGICLNLYQASSYETHIKCLVNETKPKQKMLTIDVLSKKVENIIADIYYSNFLLNEFHNFNYRHFSNPRKYHEWILNLQ